MRISSRSDLGFLSREATQAYSLAASAPGRLRAQVNLVR